MVQDGKDEVVDKFRENKKLALADYLDANRKKIIKN